MNKKRLIKYLLLTLFAVILASGCSKSVEIQDVSGSAEKDDEQYEQVDQSKQDENATEEGISLQMEEVTPSQTEETKNSGESTKHKPSKTESAQQTEVASVIVKSENNLSDSEKQEIIDQLSKEVDGLLTEINSVE